MAEEHTEAASGEREGYKEAEARFFKGLTYHGEWTVGAQSRTHVKSCLHWYSYRIHFNVLLSDSSKTMFL